MTRFVFVDNDPNTVADELREALGAENIAIATYPDDFLDGQAPDTKALLDDCSVVLMDLDLYGGQSPTFGLRPRNGIALEETIRGWLSHAGQPLDAARRAYVLFSHELAKLAGSRGVSGREHVLARLTGNEWVASKNAMHRAARHADLSFLSQIADAVESEPNPWPQEGPQLRSAVLAQLGLDEGGDQFWHKLASDDAERIGLPLQSIGEGHGVALLRWLLHVALPFPSCLMNLSEVAVTFRIGSEALSVDGEAREKLIAQLSQYRYQGPLFQFLGERWWRAGVMSFRSMMTEQARKAGDSLAQTMRNVLDAPKLEILQPELVHPVLVVDENFVQTSEVADVSQCVRILADDWPEELDRPWMTLEMVLTTERLRALVHPDDRYRLPEAA